jgi:hypothetical protein
MSASNTPPDKKNGDRQSWSRITVSSLEADVAYFDARLALIGKEAASSYQEAQIKTYSELERILSETLAQLKGQKRKG